MKPRATGIRNQFWKRHGTGLMALLVIGIILLSGCKRFEPTGYFQISTQNVDNLGDMVYQLNGTISDLGMEEIVQHGFCWSQSTNPTTANANTKLGSRNRTGSFSSQVSELSTSTLYYIRAYAVTGSGAAYGDNIQFTTDAGGPSVETGEVFDIQPTSARFNSTITYDGGDGITGRGVCWNTTGDPTVADDRTEDGPGSGTYTSTLRELTCNTGYFVRAYAVNPAGTTYGNQVEFTSGGCGLPSVATYTLHSVTSNSARSGGNVSDDGGNPVFRRGICWSTSEDPTVDNYFTEDGVGTGTFSSFLTGLQGNTTYYSRAYATNVAGTGYGKINSFTTRAAGGPGEDVAFAGIAWIPWEEEPGYDGITGYDDNPYNKPFYSARKASAGWSFDGITSAETFDATWDLMGNSRPCMNLVSNGVAGDPYDLDSDSPSFGLVWNGVHDGTKFYVFLKFWDLNGLLDDGSAYFELMDQPTSIFRHEPTFMAASDSLAENQGACENMAYARYAELGGGLAGFRDGGITGYIASLGLQKEKRVEKPYVTGLFGTNVHGLAALESENHFWFDDGAGTLRAVYVMPFDGVLSYPADPTNMEGDWELINIGETFSFDMKVMGYIGGDQPDNLISYHWSADIDEGWASNYYAGYVNLSNQEIELPANK